MSVVTIIMPVSRNDYLDSIFARLELLECDSSKTNLLVIVDGPPSLFVRTRNFVEMSKFKERLCIQYQDKSKQLKYATTVRRGRIARIHNVIKEHVVSCDYVFGIEDDTIIHADALKKLLSDYFLYPYAGFVQGVELGRWGNPYVGAWKVDDVYDPTIVRSLMPVKLHEPSNEVVGSGMVQAIDAGGFYCFLTRRDNYVNHDFKPFDGNDFGPDFDYGIQMRRMGLLNYVDWRVTTVHKTDHGDISLLNTEPRETVFRKKMNRWRQVKL